MSAGVDAMVDVLRRAGVQLAPGLNRAEVKAVEDRFGFAFNPDHRALLAAVLPCGTGWVDWRSGRDLTRRLAGPSDGVLFDVRVNGFWRTRWGPRPADDAAADRRARRGLGEVPRLLPVYLHRYTPAAPAPIGSPVLSVHQSDVVCYGADLLDYLHREFLGGSAGRPCSAVPFWLDDGDRPHRY